jgi:hypothetical protein
VKDPDRPILLNDFNKRFKDGLSLFDSFKCVIVTRDFFCFAVNDWTDFEIFIEEGLHLRIRVRVHWVAEDIFEPLSPGTLRDEEFSIEAVLVGKINPATAEHHAESGLEQTHGEGELFS